VGRKEIVRRTTVDSQFLVSLCPWEFDHFLDVCMASPMFQERIKQFVLPPGFEVVVEPWPYGGLEKDDPRGRRFFQGLVFAVDKSTGNPDSNFYAFPLPIIPVMDYHLRQIIRIDELPTGGGMDPLVVEKPATGPVIDHCRSAEYVPELVSGGTRQDLKPLSVVQPEGPSFSVSDDNLVQWQKWRFRVSFNSREGAVIHDIHYEGRSILYRLAMSEMVRFGPNHAPLISHRGLILTRCRLYLTQTRVLRSRESRPLTLATVALGTLPTISSWVAIVLV
jgi:primary-amine oxidase